MHPAGPNPKPAYSEGFFRIAMAQSPKPQTIAIVTADGEATRLVTDGVYDNVKQAGLKIVYDRRYPLNTTDFSPIVRAARAAEPDIFFISSYPLDFRSGMLRSVGELAFTPKIVGGVPQRTAGARAQGTARPAAQRRHQLRVLGAGPIDARTGGAGR